MQVINWAVLLLGMLCFVVGVVRLVCPWIADRFYTRWLYPLTYAEKWSKTTHSGTIGIFASLLSIGIGIYMVFLSIGEFGHGR
jgi:ABC-type Fe3+ transport system permease subunit